MSAKSLGTSELLRDLASVSATLQSWYGDSVSKGSSTDIR